MKERIHLAILRIFLAYFAGAITMLLFLAPGKISLNDLLDPEKRVHLADFDQAADKLEKSVRLPLDPRSRAWARRLAKAKVATS
ncbi:hypothetical protein ACFL02_00985 [Planctomycetota bacterium]